MKANLLIAGDFCDMLFKPKRRLHMDFEVVQSLRNPGGYACEAIDYENEGAGTVVEFFADNSEELAREYVRWKNEQANAAGLNSN